MYRASVATVCIVLIGNAEDDTIANNRICLLYCTAARRAMTVQRKGKEEEKEMRFRI